MAVSKLRRSDGKPIGGNKRPLPKHKVDGVMMTMTTQHQQDAMDDKASTNTSASTQNTPETETPASQLDRARHVAGHATIALAQEIEVTVLTMESLAKVDVDLDGAYLLDEGTVLRLQQQWPARPFQHSKLAKPLLQIALAGRCAELVHRDIACTVELVKEAATDWELVWQNAEVIWPDEEERLGYLARDIRWMDRFLRHSQYMAAVGNISAALLEHGTLQGTQVKEIFERATVIHDAPARRPRRRPDYLSMPDSPGLPDCVVF